LSPYKIATLFLSGIFASTFSFSQNLDRIGKHDAVKLSGGINYSSVLYKAQGIPDRRQPFTWFVNANMNVNIIDFNLPFTLNYSNNQTTYTQPNIQSSNPTWKWIKGYAGITSMNFSQYTLANHVFAGGGLELTPKNFKFSIMYGRLKKAVEFDAENNSDLNMSYKRMGFGSMIGYEKKGHGIKLIYFTAKDDPSSLTFVPLNTNVTPMQNTVISVIGKTAILKKLRLENEYSLSGLTRNITSPSDVNSPPENKLPGLFQPNATSQFFSAFRSSLGYSLKNFNVNLNYERVAPDYKTLGAYYFNNDLENFTIAPSTVLLKGKLNLVLNTGLQRNNPNKDKLNTTNRWVGSFNASYMPNLHWNFMGSYSNFSSYTKQRPLPDPYYKNTLDTLNFYQLSQSSMLSLSHNFGKTRTKQNISLSANYQVTGQNQGNITDPGLFGTTANIVLPNKIINGNLAHSINFTKTKTSISSGINANYSQLTNADNFYIGPSLNLGQAFLKNTLRVSLGSSYNQMFSNGNKASEIFNHRLALNYNPKFADTKAGRINMMLSATYLQQLKASGNSNAFNEFTGNFGISYSF